MSECDGQVSLVGAGCGAADLITLRGLRLLQTCDVVVYDDLIDKALLEEVPAEAERIYMGKRQGRHAAAQEAICACLIEKAGQGKRVVRLKGGDPFVFGRGGEEMTALKAAGIPCQVVPGITSAIAIPALAGIPVTLRGLSRSVHIITAHTADTPDGLPADLDSLAGLSGTLVFLMGLTRLSRIVSRLMGAGAEPTRPAAVISGGNAPCPAVVRGTLADIAQRTAAARVRPPAVILVGEVAKLDLTCALSLPLAGVTVALTGSERMACEMRSILEPLGARTFAAQRSLLRQLPTSLPTEVLDSFGSRWLVFTSPNGVEAFFCRVRAEKVDLRRLAACRFAVIGDATAKCLEAQGFTADLCPERFTTAALAQTLLAATGPEEELFLLRSALGAPELLRTLEKERRVWDIPLYTVTSDPRTAEAAKDRLGEADYLTFASAGGVEMFLESEGRIPDGTVCVCIGEVTAGCLRKHYDGSVLIAKETSARGMAKEILAHVKGTAEGRK